MRSERDIADERVKAEQEPKKKQLSQAQLENLQKLKARYGDASAGDTSSNADGKARLGPGSSRSDRPAPSTDLDVISFGRG